MNPGNKLNYFLIFIVIVFVLIYDLFALKGLIGGIPYVAAVLLTLWIKNRKITVYIGFITTILVITGYFFSSGITMDQSAIIDRIFAITGIWVAVWIIYKYKYNEIQLTKNQEWLDAFFKHANEGIIISDDKGNILLANKAVQKMFRYTEDELKGEKVEILVPDRFSKNHVNHRDGFYKDPKARAMGLGIELFGKRKDKTEFPIEISLTNYRSEGKLFVIAFVIDITIRKQHEDELNYFHEQLKLRATELEASNKELENFAYISSHDLQEPLRKIQAFGDLLLTEESKKLSETGKDYIKRMLNAAFRMQTLINDLLYFSRLTTRAKPFENLNLTNLLEEVSDDLEILVKESNANINIGELPEIEGDPTQMRQLFQNLIANAIKFRKDEVEPQIQIYSELNESKNKFNIYVKDNGIGFDNKYSSKIFNIFQRLESNKYEGSGIGLAICRKIVNRHKGEITAKSKPGAGTTFIITLPLNQA